MLLWAELVWLRLRVIPTWRNMRHSLDPRRSVERLSEIPNRRGWRVLRAKHTQHKSRPVHHGHNHIDIRGIHSCFDDFLDVGDLQCFDRGNRRRRHRHAAPATAAHQQQRENSGNPQRQQNAQRQHLSTLFQGAPRRDRSPNGVFRLHKGYLP